MKIGIGLPNTVPGAQGAEIRDWAIRAEAAGFSTLGTIDRLVYANHESLIALSFAAAVTERIGLLTSMLLGPLRTNHALLAKQAASLDVLSGGRLILGLTPGGREDDYEVSGIDFHRRAALFDQQLDDLRRFWSGSEIGPAAQPSVVIGGRADASFRRAAQFDGWMMGGGDPSTFPPEIERLDAAWTAAGREGRPRQMSLAYFGLGDGASQQIHDYIAAYYSYIGDAVDGFAASVPADPAAIRERIDAFAAVGCDELIWFPTSSDPNQVELLAEAAL